MSDKRLLDKYIGRTTESVKEPSAPAESEVTDDAGTFGVLRGIQERATMIELRKRTGTILAVGYSWIEKMEYDPSGEITLYCGTRLTVKIQGRHLNSELRPMVKLFHALTRHKVSFIAESNQSHIVQAGKDQVVIESIGW